jgi:phage FluMu gp28-like protein
MPLSRSETGVHVASFSWPPAIDQAKLLLGAITRLLAKSPLGGLVEAEVASPFPEIRLARGGLVFVRAAHEHGRYLRGHSADRVVVDEAAYLPDEVIVESISPILADTGGSLILASTPTARGNVFHRLFERGRQGTDPEVASFTLRSLDNPHVDAGYIEGQRREMTEAQYRTEYEGEFADAAGSLFRWDHVIACAVGAEEPPVPDRRYVLGWDPAIVRDRSGVVVLDVTCKPWRVVHVTDLRGRDYIEQVGEIATIAREHGKAKVIVDETAHGRVLVELLAREGTWVEGVMFTPRSKADLVTGLAVLFERRELVLPARRDLLDELRRYEVHVSDTGAVKYGAVSGTDDLVTALALAVRGAGGHSEPRSFAEAGLPPFLTSSMPLGAMLPPDGFDESNWLAWGDP